MPNRSFSPSRLVLAFVLLIPFVGLGSWPLIDPDEARTAEVAREMLASGDWIVPRINGLPRLDKPMLPYAATAASLAVFGHAPFAARVPAALATSLACAFLAFAFWRELGERRAISIAAMTASAPLVLFWSRGGTIDALLLLWMTIGFAGFWRAMTDTRRVWSIAAWIAMGLGVLTKGPVALLPLGVALVFAWREGARIRLLFPLTGIAVAIALVTPWVLAVQRRYPDFLEYVVSVETVARTTTTDLGRGGPIFLPLATLVIGALPWAVLLIGSLFDREKFGSLRSSPLFRYAGLWIVLPLMLFTVISSRRPQYVLPLIPAVAIAASLAWPAGTRARRAAGVAAIVFGLLLIGALPLAQRETDVPLAPLLALSLGGGAVWVISGSFVLRSKLLAAAATLALFPFALIPFLASEGPEMGGVATARELRARGLVDAPIYGLHTYSPSLAFELRRTYGVVTHHGQELGGNYINRHYERLVDAPGSPLRSRGWYDRNRGSCAEPMIMIARANDRSTMAHLEESAIPILFRNDRFVVADPCGYQPVPGEAASR